MRVTFSFLFIFYFTTVSITQNCFSANIESGTLDGFTAFTGTINESGKVILEQQGIDSSRHRIMHISEGFDTIALRHCEINKFLPVVPEDGEQFTLRLGNGYAGAEADLIGLKFTVTPDMPFFQLRYAVVLNDPKHHEFEQPRFELKIIDESNTVIPCGQYKVKAAPEIPDFESCREGWRIRPWTTVGFDLQPYIGQTLLIEFLTTDCTQGAHAGYAYLEATCKPFKMEVKEHCPEDAVTTASISDGYNQYLWNTGETTTSINIPNPEEHSEYTVTVTSVTGCSFVMKDTLAFSYPPKFEPERDATFCRDTQFWFTPKGMPLFDISSPTLGITADSFLIGNDRPDYTFISANANNCYSDTLTFSLSKAPLPITSTESTLACFDDQNGSLVVNSTTDFPPLNYHWSNNATDSTLNNLSAGTYTVTISDAINCQAISTLTVYSPPELDLNNFNIEPITCNGMNNAALTINPVGGVQPYEYSWSTQQRNTNELDNLGAGEYSVTVTDAMGCTDEDSVAIYEPDPLLLDALVTNATCFAMEDGTIDLAIEGGVAPYTITWEDSAFESDAFRANVGAGNYSVTLTDAMGCADEERIVINEPDPLVLEAIATNITCFAQEDGTIDLAIEGGIAPYTITWEDDAFESDAFQENVGAGNYAVTLTDAMGCTDEDSVIVNEPAPLVLEAEATNVTCFANEDGTISLAIEGGIAPYTITWEDDAFERDAFRASVGAGNYSVTLTDAMGCTDEDSVSIIEPDPLVLEAVATNVTCFANEDGTIDLAIEGGIAPYTITWEDDAFERDAFRGNVGAGIYRAFIMDEIGCEKDIAISIKQPTLSKACGTYIPNVFSPNGDNLNDNFFVVGSLSGIAMTSMQIYNRWGELVYENQGECTEIGNESCGWNGLINNRPASVGVYVYLITIETPSQNKPVLFTGDVTLTR